MHVHGNTHICVLQSYVITSCAAEFVYDVLPLHADWSIFRVDINVYQYGKMLMFQSTEYIGTRKVYIISR